LPLEQKNKGAVNSCLAVCGSCHWDEESTAEIYVFVVAESRGTGQTVAKINASGFCLCCSHTKNHG